MRASARTVLVVALAVGLLALFLRNADLRQVWAEIRRARLDLLVLTLVTVGVNMVLRAVRWQYLLRPIGNTSFRNAFRTTTIGFAASFLLPARAGEFLRPYLLARRENLSATAAFATIVLERLIDLITVLVLLGAFVVLFDPGLAAVDPAVYQGVKFGGGFVAAGAIVMLIVTFVLAGHPETLGRGVLRIQALLPRRAAHAIAGLVRMFAEGLAVVRQPARLLVTLALSLPLWLSVATGIWASACAFEIAVPYTGSFLLMALLTVGVAVPTPGAVGGFHEAFRIGATTFYGAPNDRAVGAAIVLHAISFVPVTLLGVFFIAQDGLNLSRMRSLAGLASTKGESGEVPVLRPSGR